MVGFFHEDSYFAVWELHALLYVALFWSVSLEWRFASRLDSCIETWSCTRGQEYIWQISKLTLCHSQPRGSAHGHLYVLVYTTETNTDIITKFIKFEPPNFKQANAPREPGNTIAESLPLLASETSSTCPSVARRLLRGRKVVMYKRGLSTRGGGHPNLRQATQEWVE